MVLALVLIPVRSATLIHNHVVCFSDFLLLLASSESYQRGENSGITLLLLLATVAEAILRCRRAHNRQGPLSSQLLFSVQGMTWECMTRMFILLVARPETKPHSCAKHVTTYKEHGSRLRRASLFVTSRFFAGGGSRLVRVGRDNFQRPSCRAGYEEAMQGGAGSTVVLMGYCHGVARDGAGLLALNLLRIEVQDQRNSHK